MNNSIISNYKNVLFSNFEFKVSTSSLSENTSVNNDSATPISPLTPPPSPLSSNHEIISCNKSDENETNQTNETPTNDKNTAQDTIESGSESIENEENVNF